MTEATLKLGKPVKAHKYYSEGEWKEWEQGDTPVYTVGRRKKGKIAYTGDVKPIQAGGSDVAFITSNNDLSFDELEDMAGKAFKHGFENELNLRRVYLYDGGDLKPTLESTPGYAGRKLDKILNYIDEDIVEVEKYPEIDKLVYLHIKNNRSSKKLEDEVV